MDELAGQVQMLEAAKTRLEMSIEQMRKENKKEILQRDEEVEEVRIAAQKKVKGKTHLVMNGSRSTSISLQGMNDCIIKKSRFAFCTTFLLNSFKYGVILFLNSFKNGSILLLNSLKYGGT